MAEALAPTAATGKRKTAVARVRLNYGTGQVKVNGKPMNEYFHREVLLMRINAAFEAIPAEILSDIVADPAILTAVLTYHVSPGKADPRRAWFPRERGTLQGQTVFFNRGRQGPQVNQANVQCQGVKTDNGIVWIIDSVLLPQFTTL